MGQLEVAHVDYYLPDGRLLLADVSFRIGRETCEPVWDKPRVKRAR